MRVKALFFSALLAVFSLTGCNVDQVSLSSKLKGKWVLAQVDKKDVPTDNGFIITFTSPTTANISMLVDSNDETVAWAREVPVDVVFSGETVTLKVRLENGDSYNYAMHVRSLYDDMMICDCKVTGIIGLNLPHEEYSGVFLRDDVDYRQAIIGTWEGDELRDDDSGLPDGRRCRFEFLPDGTYNYYHQEMDESWKQSLDEFSFYFCDADVLFMHWKNLGLGLKARSSSWEFEIKNNTMHWKGLRMREDGSTYTLSVDFDKVQI